MQSNAQRYGQLCACLDTVPLIDCHHHSKSCGPECTDPILIVIGQGGYFSHDIRSVCSDRESAIIEDAELLFITKNSPNVAHESVFADPDRSFQLAL